MQAILPVCGPVIAAGLATSFAAGPVAHAYGPSNTIDLTRFYDKINPKYAVIEQPSLSAITTRGNLGVTVLRSALYTVVFEYNGYVQALIDAEQKALDSDVDPVYPSPPPLEPILKKTGYLLARDLATQTLRKMYEGWVYANCGAHLRWKLLKNLGASIVRKSASGSRLSLLWRVPPTVLRCQLCQYAAWGSVSLLMNSAAAMRVGRSHGGERGRRYLGATIAHTATRVVVTWAAASLMTGVFATITPKNCVLIGAWTADMGVFMLMELGITPWMLKGVSGKDAPPPADLGNDAAICHSS